MCWCLPCKGHLFYWSGKELIKVIFSEHGRPCISTQVIWLHSHVYLNRHIASFHWCDKRVWNNFIKYQLLLSYLLFVIKPVIFPSHANSAKTYLALKRTVKERLHAYLSQLSSWVQAVPKPSGSDLKQLLPISSFREWMQPLGNVLMIIMVINSNNRGNFLFLFGDHLLKIPKLPSMLL